MSGDQLDLDAIEARAARATEHIGTSSYAYPVVSVDVPALVAEIERLQTERDALRTSVAGLRASLNFKQGAIDDLSATVERMDAENCGCVNP